MAFSGGADSTLVAKVAKDELGGRALAVTIDSPLYPRSELTAARAVARKIGIKHVVTKLDPLRERSFVSNPPDRCYHCKMGDFREIKRIADSFGMTNVIDGSNADDKTDYRPGARAKAELGVRSPLAEAGLTKSDVRALSARLKLSTSRKSSSPCLASRIPYGEKITEEKLAMIEAAEDYLRSKGLATVRVRAHGDIARIEVDAKDIHRLASTRTRKLVSRKLKDLGFAYVTIDLDGYRTGSLNEVLKR